MKAKSRKRMVEKTEYYMESFCCQEGKDSIHHNGEGGFYMMIEYKEGAECCRWYINYCPWCGNKVEHADEQEQGE